MNEIRLKNFRCFRNEQTARLAPLTLLVGENSTGKTSFMAMVRILSDMAYRSMEPGLSKKTPTISEASMRSLITGEAGVVGGYVRSGVQCQAKPRRGVEQQL